MSADGRQYIQKDPELYDLREEPGEAPETDAPLRIFPATRPLESLAIDILGPLSKTTKCHRFLLVISDRFSKLTQVVPLRNIGAYTVAVAFVEA